MNPILILYATREGHTRSIADRMAGAAQARGVEADVFDVGGLPKQLNLEGYRAVVICASVHSGRHEPEMVAFVKRYLGELHVLNTVFLSVSLSEAGAEDEDSPPDKRAKAAAGVQTMIDRFLSETGWNPGKIRAVAGALLYRRYNLVLRLMMKRIAEAAGGDTDTSRDYEYTDWAGLDRIVAEICQGLTQSAAQ